MTTVTNSTISGNSAVGTGGGISFFSGSTIVINTTVTGNSAGVNGGGIGGGGLATVTSSIVANSASGGDLFTTTSFSGSNNLIEDGSGPGLTGTISGDPLLGPLADNGGPTWTHALLPGSPALDAGNSTEPTDQRGFTVPVDLASVPNAAGGNASDIGAYEAQAAPSADYVDDDVINGLDFLAWQIGFGITSGAVRADGNSDDDGDVDGSDLAAWEATYGLVELTPLVAAIGSGQSAVASEVRTDELSAISSQQSASLPLAELVDAAMASEWLGLSDEPAERLVVEEALAEAFFAARPPTATPPSVAPSSTPNTTPQIRADEEAAGEAELTDQPWLAEELLERVFG